MLEPASVLLSKDAFPTRRDAHVDIDKIDVFSAPDENLKAH